MQDCPAISACGGADPNGDRRVDMNDFNILASQWLIIYNANSD